MSLSNGRPYLAIPGPSVLPDRVVQAMMRPSPNIYQGELVDMTATIIPDLKSVARTTGHVAIYIANGHGVWEAALSNVLSRGDKILVLVTGRFGHGWAEMARGLHLDLEVMDFGQQASIDLNQVETRLKADTDHSIKAVLAVHVDTSTSIKNDIAGVRQAMDAAGHPAVLMADCIASMGCDRFEMDAWGADVTIAASQKGLMTPAGLGFVWFNDRATAARESADLATRYWDWKPRVSPEMFYQHFAGTPPTHQLFGLRAALDMINEEGIEQVWARHETLARTVWAAVEAWGQGGEMRLNMTDPAGRGHSVTSIYLGGNDADRLRHWCEEHAGVTLGIGLGREPTSAWFRIGHMGHVNAHMVLGTLSVIDAGLKALQIPHGEGALSAAASVVAGV